MNPTITQRVNQLRQAMQQHGLAAVIIPSDDAHGSEYTPDHWQGRAWISGFNGSAGTAVVTLHSAALWTDSRYFLAAAEQLDGTPFQLMKLRVEGTPSIAEWLCQELEPGQTVGFDGFVMGCDEVRELSSALAAKGIAINSQGDLLDAVWTDRPAIPSDPAWVFDIAQAGESVASKIARLRTELSRRGCDTMLVSALDEVAWLCNLRGSDVHCNPVAVAYALVSPRDAVLYIHAAKLTPAVREHLEANGIATADYDAMLPDVARRCQSERFLITPQTSWRLAETLTGHAETHPSPVAEMKAVKNPVEQEGFRQAMLRDGVAMVRFLRQLDENVEAFDELKVDELLTRLRSEQPGYLDLSFDTIAAYGPHGAIVHYEADQETNIPLQPRGFLLLDSGGHYDCGTTDITRTIALGPLTDEERRVYTLVLKGHIALSTLVFPDGASGTQVDLAARAPLWREGLNYGHGTGHGVGHCLNVHEGPHQIRMEYRPAPLRAGMTVTNEPGIYLAGRFGVRIENTLLIVPDRETECGRFLRFEPLTLCPIDTRPILWELLTEDEKAWLKDYHTCTREALLPLLTDPADRAWLIAACGQ